MPMTLVQPLSWRQPIRGLAGKNERTVELPLAVAFLRIGGGGSILDAGCALNQSMLEPVALDWTHLTQNLGDERVHEHSKRTYVEGDLRDLSMFRDQQFDRVASVSTLEHVGCDNSGYGGPVEDCPETVRMAADELWRVTKHVLLFTVPFRITPWRERAWRYFTPETLDQILVPGAEVVYYRREWDGWAGPFDEPGVSPFEDEPHHPPQIAVMYACR